MTPPRRPLTLGQQLTFLCFDSDELDDQAIDSGGEDYGEFDSATRSLSSATDSATCR